MTEPVEQKLVSMLDALQSGVVEIGGKLVKYTPDVVDAGLAVVRIDCASNLIYSALFVFAVAACWCALIKWCKEIDVETNSQANIIRAFLLVPLAIVAIRLMLDVWWWVGMFEPKLYIAHKIMEQVMK